MDKTDRYKILVRHLLSIGMASNQKELGTLIGYNNASAFSQVINGKAPEPKNFSNRFKEIFPQLNLEWLETGNGCMVTDNDDTDTLGSSGQGIAIQKHGNTTVDRIIDALNAQTALTKEAHELARNAQAQVDKAQSQIDRLLSLLENRDKIPDNLS